MATPSILAQTLGDQSQNYYDTVAFRVVIEDFLEVLKTSTTTQIVTVDPNVYYQWRFDWRGLLIAMGVPLTDHWATIRMNGGTSYTDVPKELSTLLIPETGYLSNLASIMNSRKRIG